MNKTYDVILMPIVTRIDLPCSFSIFSVQSLVTDFRTKRTMT